MPAPGNVLEHSLTEVSFLKTALLSSIRPDGRTFVQARSVHVEFDPEELGWVQVVLGDRGTRVVVSTHAALVAPRVERPYEGFVDVRAEVQPIAGWQFERGRANDEEVAFERGLDRAIRRSDVVDREALCVVAGYKVWSITLNVHLLCARGAALDAAVLACIVALRHFRRPDVSVVSSSSERQARVTVHDSSERVPVALALHHHPYSVSFAIFDPAHMAESYVSGVGAGGASSNTHKDVTDAADDDDEANVIILVDPTPLESTLCTSKIHVVANVQGEVCVLDKAGGRPLSESIVNRVIGLARIRVKELNDSTEKALQRDAAQRVVEVQ